VRLTKPSWPDRNHAARDLPRTSGWITDRFAIRDRSGKVQGADRGQHGGSHSQEETQC
jgi:hypothetical protein